jgi:hypothetical protein
VWVADAVGRVYGIGLPSQPTLEDL